MKYVLVFWLAILCIIAASAGGWYIAAGETIGWYLAGGGLLAMVGIGSWMIYEPKQKEDK